MMKFSEFIDQVKVLEFIPDEDTADAAIKAVPGILVSNLDEAEAKQLCENLPQELALEEMQAYHNKSQLDFTG